LEVFTFLAKTIIGLNIHLCCLIERLIKKEEIVSHINIVDFEKIIKNLSMELELALKRLLISII